MWDAHADPFSNIVSVTMARLRRKLGDYEATVGALCQAVETKDFYTRGHSDRVSRGSVMIAREIGIRGERVEAIRYAGMLHYVGKLGVPTKVLQKTGKLTELSTPSSSFT